MALLGLLRHLAIGQAIDVYRAALVDSEVMVVAIILELVAQMLESV